MTAHTAFRTWSSSCWDPIAHSLTIPADKGKIALYVWHALATPTSSRSGGMPAKNEHHPAGKPDCVNAVVAKWGT